MPFPPMRVLEVHWSWALSLMCEVALSTTKFLCPVLTNIEVGLYSTSVVSKICEVHHYRTLITDIQIVKKDNLKKMIRD